MTIDKLPIIRSFRPLLVPGVITLFILVAPPILTAVLPKNNLVITFIIKYGYVLVIAALTWTLTRVVKSLSNLLKSKYDLQEVDNLKSRKVHTQIQLLEQIAIVLIFLFGVGLILISFESIRKIGIGLFASAGLAGIIIGFAAQKVLGALIAGIQIAFTQPFRIDDALLVENEWGWVEEINLTYVVMRLWDKRRLVLPSTYFIEKPFQNWTRNNAEIVGSIFLHTDYRVPFDAMRKELDNILSTTDLWNGKVKVLQVTDSTPTTVVTRILVSANNSPTAWDLRVHVREKMIKFLQEKHPESLPVTRILIPNDQHRD